MLGKSLLKHGNEWVDGVALHTIVGQLFLGLSFTDADAFAGAIKTARDTFVPHLSDQGCQGGYVVECVCVKDRQKLVGHMRLKSEVFGTQWSSVKNW